MATSAATTGQASPRSRRVVGVEGRVSTSAGSWRSCGVVDEAGGRAALVVVASPSGVVELVELSPPTVSSCWGATPV
ncbi:MAG: hypothetical protein R2711_16600 [Acidimicrobiales bacterium]